MYGLMAEEESTTKQILPELHGGERACVEAPRRRPLKRVQSADICIPLPKRRPKRAHNLSDNVALNTRN